MNLSKMDNTNVLLVGGTGFLGRHLADEYAHRGCNVTILSRKEWPNFDTNQKYKHLSFDLEAHVPWDEITQDVDLAYFLYSPNIPRTSPQVLSKEIYALTAIGQSFLESCVKNNVKTVCFPSSGGAIYGKSEDEILTENSITNPISNYGLSKLVFEKMLIMYQNLYNLDYLIFRLSNVYGPFQNLNKPQGVISHWLKSIIHGETIEIWGTGEVKRDYIYVSDAVAAMVLATESKVRNEIFNLGYGESHSLLEILELFKTKLGLDANYAIRESHHTDVKDASIHVSHFKSTFGWYPKVKLDEGMQKTFDFLKELYGK